MEIVWTETASGNLDYFADQIYRNSKSRDVAEKFYQKVLSRSEKLMVRPTWIGVPVKEFPGLGYRSIFTMDYRIIYRVSGQTVYIITFLHKRMIISENIDKVFE